MVIQTIIKGILTALCLVICALVLQQGGHNDGINGLINTTSNLSLFAKQKLRGTDLVITRIIGVCVFVLIALIITLKHI